MAGFPLKKWWALQLALIDLRLSKSAPSVLARLLYHHNTKTDLCYPSEARLAEALGCTTRSIRTSLKSLETFGYIQIARGAGRNGTNRYFMSMPTGRKAYEEAEKRCRSYRKKPSTKQMKEHLKEKQKVPTNIVDRKKRNPSGNRSERTQAQNSELLQTKLVQALGGGAKSWEKVLSICDETRSKYELQFHEGKLPLGQAVAEMAAHLAE